MEHKRTDSTLLKENLISQTEGQKNSQAIQRTIETEEDDSYVEADSYEKDQDSLNGVWTTALAIISTIMGGGIVSIPYAYAVEGIGIGITIQICVISAIWVSCILYLQTRLILRCNTTFGEIASLCLGSVSGIVLNLLIVFAIFGIMALYMILFSEIAISLIGSGNEDTFLSKKLFYVCLLSLSIAPIIVRKRIQELKISTYVLFIGVICLISLLTILLIINGSYDYRVEQGIIVPKVVVVDDEQKVGTFEGIMDSVNIAVASQGFVIALFPIYSSMARTARPRVMTSVSTALFFTMTIYTYLSFISISYFGQENIKPSIFVNIQDQEGIASILLRCLFMMIFFCNIPFVFFAGKVALLAVVQQIFYSKDEADNTVEPDQDEFIRATTETQADSNQDRSLLQLAQAERLEKAMATSTSYASQSNRQAPLAKEDEMPYAVYLISVFTYLILVACAAIFIDDLTLIFGIIAGVAECTTVFILPSIFYLVACNQEDKRHEAYEKLVQAGEATLKDRPNSKKGGKTVARLCVYGYLVMGVAYFFVSNYFNFAKIIR